MLNFNYDWYIYYYNYWYLVVELSVEWFYIICLSDIVLFLLSEEDLFVFVVFGDWIGGLVDGVNVFVDVVWDVNLIEFDLVMIVGDLINGYN